MHLRMGNPTFPRAPGGPGSLESKGLCARWRLSGGQGKAVAVGWQWSAQLGWAWRERGLCHHAFSPSAKPRPLPDGRRWPGVRSEKHQCSLAGGHPLPKTTGSGAIHPASFPLGAPPPRNRGAAEAAPTAICRPHLPETPPARLLFPHSLQRWTEGWGRPGDPRSRYTEDGNKLPFQLRLQLGEAVTPRTYRRLWGRMHMNEKELFPISYSD